MVKSGGYLKRRFGVTLDPTTWATAADLRKMFHGKRVALVCSGPGVLHNPPGFIDSQDVVVRVNNYKLSPAAGFRTDVFYSFFGNSIKKTSEELSADGVKLCICKCPDAHAIQSDWHQINNKMTGVDFRWIYSMRRGWWFCPTYVPTVEEFTRHFDLLGQHVPTSGFAALLTILENGPANVFITGMDFFQSGVHNVNEYWRAGPVADPIGHVPDIERQWIAYNIPNLPITTDEMMADALLCKVTSQQLPQVPMMTKQQRIMQARREKYRLAREKRMHRHGV